jgi:voltage-gated potassium channel
MTSTGPEDLHSVTARRVIDSFIQRHEISWELAFAGLALVFVELGFVDPADAQQSSFISTVEWAITGVFAVEFVVRLWAAPQRLAHLRGHWIDVVSLIPPARWLRPFRLLRLLRLVRAFAGVGRAVGHVGRMATHRGLVWMVVAWFAVTVITSIGLYTAEHGINPAFDDSSDAVWWGVVTLTTVGYGDVYPLTPEGRIAAMMLLILGIGLYSAITAAITSYFVAQGSSSSATVGELERLAALRDRGALTDDEYAQAKTLALSQPNR